MTLPLPKTPLPMASYCIRRTCLMFVQNVWIILQIHAVRFVLYSTVREVRCLGVLLCAKLAEYNVHVQNACLMTVKHHL